MIYIIEVVEEVTGFYARLVSKDGKKIILKAFSIYSRQDAFSNLCDLMKDKM